MSKLLVLLLGLSVANAGPAVTLSNAHLGYVEADTPCHPPSDPFCPYGPVVAYTITNDTNGAIVAQVRCTIPRRLIDRLGRPREPCFVMHSVRRRNMFRHHDKPLRGPSA